MRVRTVCPTERYDFKNPVCTRADNGGASLDLQLAYGKFRPISIFEGATRISSMMLGKEYVPLKEMMMAFKCLENPM